MVEVYGKKARQINMQDPATDAHTPGLTCSKEGEVEEKKGRKQLPVLVRGIKPTTLTLQGPFKARLQSYSNIYIAQRSLASVAL